MLTPLFDIEQNDQLLYITIKAPLAKISSAEISIEGNEFFFSAKPYFLRLYLPKQILENGSETVDYNADSGEFRVSVFKKTFGEYFPGLNLITKLLTPDGGTSAKPFVEELDDSQQEKIDESMAADGKQFFEQKLPEQLPSTSFGYGFNNARKGIFFRLRDEIGSLIEVPDPDRMTNEERKRLAFQNEEQKFSEDHYLADFFSPEIVEPLMSFVAWWNEDEPPHEKFTLEEKDRLKNLPKRRYDHISESEIRIIMLSLLDILFAYAYDFRTTSGDNNSESGWLIAKLSATLSCFVSWESIEECLASCVRRSLCYPLYRNWELALKILDDVRRICALGRIATTKCFLDVHKLFATSGEYRYILNDLYITDYCIWLQHANDRYFAQLAEELKVIILCKKAVALDLEELELAGKLAIDDEAGGSKEANQDLSVGKRTLLEYVRGHAITDNIDENDSDDSESSPGMTMNEDVTKLNVKISDLTLS